MNASLYLLSKEVRQHSTVALSGECADEVFGGYKWIHDAGAQKASIFPWLVQGAGDQTVDPFERAFNPDVEKALGLAEYARESYRSAVAGIERAPGEDDREFTMRTVSYLHLTRFMQLLLERKDRMSMAAGLEVRVPYCDHRLVEYVYNAPWSMKTADGREKSLLRSAAADVLPRSVSERVKSPYPPPRTPCTRRPSVTRPATCWPARITPCSTWSTGVCWRRPWRRKVPPPLRAAAAPWSAPWTSAPGSTPTRPPSVRTRSAPRILESRPVRTGSPRSARTDAGRIGRTEQDPQVPPGPTDQYPGPAIERGVCTQRGT